MYTEVKMKELLIAIAQGLVEDPTAVNVDVDDSAEDGSIVYHLHVAEADMGRVIGKQGRTARALRTLLGAASSKAHRRVMLEIVE